MRATIATVAVFLTLAASAAAHEARQVTVSGLNVRSGPSTGYSIIGLAHSPEKYVVVTKSGSWAKIWWAGNTGWIHTGYTSTTGGVGVEITALSLNARTGPSTGYSSVGMAHKGEIYVQITTSGVWKKIYFGGAGRWVHGGYTTAHSLTTGSSPAPSGSRKYYPTAYELDIFRRTVMAESGGEPYQGQVAVAAVILNRIRSSGFPNTMSGVIFQPWQFTPATNGQIWNVYVSQSVKNACEAALNWSDPSLGALYFYAWRLIAPPSWTYSKQHTVTIGGHKFYK